MHLEHNPPLNPRQAPTAHPRRRPHPHAIVWKERCRRDLDRPTGRVERDLQMRCNNPSTTEEDDVAHCHLRSGNSRDGH
jgi:hypothetical protein